MKRFEILTDKNGKKYVGESPDGPYADRTEAERVVLNTVKRSDMTSEAWRSLQHLREE